MHNNGNAHSIAIVGRAEKEEEEPVKHTYEGGGTWYFMYQEEEYTRGCVNQTRKEKISNR